MNEQDHRDEGNLERLMRAGFGTENRPSPAAREEAWRRVRSAWQSEYNSAAAAQESASELNSKCCAAPTESQNKLTQAKKLFMGLFMRNPWKFGLGTVAGAAGIALIIALTTPKVHATAAQVLARGAEAVSKLTSVHLRGQLRTLPADNFGYINADLDFQSIELWKQIEPELKWKVEKPGRTALMDGSTTLLYIKPANMAVKIDKPSGSAFDTEWLQHIANLSQTISNDLTRAQAKGWKLELAEETAADGSIKDVVTVHARPGIPDGDYVKNAFLDNADTRRVYRFDDKTELLESVQIYLVRTNAEVQVFELSQIDYNKPIVADVWEANLPADVNYYQEPQKLPDNDRYTSMTAEEAARTFFEACGREDWEEVGKFFSPVTSQLKESMGGLKIVSLGQAFTSQAYPGKFVPYEIRFKPQTMNIRVANTNAAKRFILTGAYDSKLKLQEDLKYSGEPEILPNNDAYAKLSAVETVQAYLDAQTRMDWTEMRKFTSQYDVDHTKSQVEAIKKMGMDIKNVMPVIKAIEAVPTPDGSGYFVKCLFTDAVKKHNLAVRNDNPSGRWQVDGGF